MQGASLRPGTHLDLIGAFTPAMRERDDACLQGTRVFVDTEEAALKAGDLIEPMRSGVFEAADVQATLAQLCRQEKPGRRSPDEVTIFKSVGNALEDLAAGELVHAQLHAAKR